MSRPWYRQLFSGWATSAQELTQAKAEAGDAEAQFMMGLRLSSGTGATQNFSQAADWYLRAADQNHPVAQFNLGVMFAQGQGVERDEAAALRWTSRAAEAGDAAGQYSLGMRCHRASIRNEPSAAIESRIEAYKWFQLAAAQGYKDSLASRARVTSHMTHADVTEANQRAKRFQPRHGIKPAGE